MHDRTKEEHMLIVRGCQVRTAGSCIFPLTWKFQPCLVYTHAMQSEATKAKIKHTASFCNNLAVALISLGVIGPFFTNILSGLSSGEGTAYIIGVVAVAAALHEVGSWYLSEIEG